jgi:hypothetical protein
MTTDLQNAFNNLIEEQRALRAKFQETAQALFKETTKEFFNKNPGVTAIHWTQYTPYFNDGDTCEFSVGDIYYTNANDDQMEEVCTYAYEGEDENVWSYSAWELRYGIEKEGKIFEGVSLEYAENFSGLIYDSDMEEVMKEMFGDHVRVIATREGFDVQDYDHE